MEDEKNYPEKEKTTKKMEEGGGLMEDEMTTKKTEDEENDTEKEETTKKMEEASDPMQEESKTKKMEEASDPMQEETKTEKMEEERNPEPEEKEANWVLTSSPSPSPSPSMVLNLSRKRKRSQRKKVDVNSQKEKMTTDKGKKIVIDKWEPKPPGLGDLLGLGLIPLPPRIHNLCKFENMQIGSSSEHQKTTQVNEKQRQLMINEKQKIRKQAPYEDIQTIQQLPLEIIGSFVSPSVLESNVLEPSCIGEVEVTDLKDSQLPQLEVARNERKAEDGPRRWRPPENGWLKMNVEGLISEHKMATCAVVRNSDGGFLAANADTWEPVTHVDTAKLIALRNALIWAETGDKVRHNEVVVEMNSEQVVQHLRDFETVSRMLPGDLREIVDECLVLSTHFQTIEFANISAEENRLAHCLASRALHQECEGEWDAFNAPDWLQEAIMEDLPH